MAARSAAALLSGTNPESYHANTHKKSCVPFGFSENPDGSRP
jgi:hypothetical protein